MPEYLVSEIEVSRRVTREKLLSVLELLAWGRDRVALHDHMSGHTYHHYLI